MTGPITRNENDVMPSVPSPFSQSGVGHSGQQTNTWNINQPMPWLVLLAIIAGVSLGLSIGSRDTANRAERESRLQRLEVDELKVALQMQGIKVHEGVSP